MFQTQSAKVQITARALRLDPSVQSPSHLVVDGGPQRLRPSSMQNGSSMDRNIPTDLPSSTTATASTVSWKKINTT